MTDDPPANDWLQTRQRIDWMLGPLCMLVAASTVVAYRLTGRPSVFASLLLAIGIWLWFRRTVPTEGRRYMRNELRHFHAFMIFTAAVALPTFLAIYAVDWLRLPHAVWIYFGILAIFLGTMITGGELLDRKHRRVDSQASASSHDSHPNNFPSPN